MHPAWSGERSRLVWIGIKSPSVSFYSLLYKDILPHTFLLVKRSQIFTTVLLLNTPYTKYIITLYHAALYLKTETKCEIVLLTQPFVSSFKNNFSLFFSLHVLGYTHNFKANIILSLPETCKPCWDIPIEKEKTY